MIGVQSPLVLLLAIAAVANCSSDTGVMFGYKVKPSSYRTEDGVSWSSTDVAQKNEYSDAMYSGLRNQTGYLSKGLGRLTDEVSTRDSSNNIWVRWHQYEVALMFEFHQNVSLCQIDIHARSDSLPRAKFEIFYAQDLSNYLSWGDAQATNFSIREMTFNIPRQTARDSTLRTSKSTRQVIIYAFFPDGVERTLDVSEFTFWECTCPKALMPTTCWKSNAYLTAVPCAIASCPGDPAADCYNNYCGDSKSGDCSAAFLSSTSDTSRATCSTAQTTQPATSTAPPTPRPELRITSGSTAIYWTIIGVLAGVLVLVLLFLLVRGVHFHNAQKRQRNITPVAMMDEGRYSAATLSRHFVNCTALSSEQDSNSNSASVSNSFISIGESRTSLGSSDSPSLAVRYKMPRVCVDGKPLALTSYSIPRPQCESTSMIHTKLSEKIGIVSRVSGGLRFVNDDSGTDLSPGNAGDEYVPMDGLNRPGSHSNACPYEEIPTPQQPEHALPPLYERSVNVMKPTPPSSTHDSSSEGGGNDNIARR